MESVVDQRADAVVRMPETAPPRNEAIPWMALRAAWWKALLASAVGAALAASLVRALPAWYESSAELALVPGPDPTMQVGTPMDGVGTELQLLTVLLHSQRVADQAIERLGLQAAWRASSPEAARRELEKHVTIAVDRKANVVTVRVEDRDPARARELARTLGELASHESLEVWSSRPRTHRLLLEGRLKRAGEELQEARAEMEAFSAREHLVDLPEQLRATVAEAARLRQLQADKRLQLRFAASYGRGSDEVRRARRELSDIRQELAAIKSEAADGLLPLDRLPTIERRWGELKAAVDAASERYEGIARQIEQLRTVEARPVGRAELIDPPAIPRRPSRPSRPMLAAGGALAGLTFFCAWFMRRGRLHTGT